MILTWFERSGRSERVAPAGTYAGIDLAPDGNRFTVHRHEGDGGDSWFFDAGRLQRLTFDISQDNSMPVWSRDGNRIAFGSRRNGKYELCIKASDGAGEEDCILESEIPVVPMSWSVDDKILLYSVNDPKTRGDIWMIPLDGDRKPTALVQSPANEVMPVVSPDGKWMAFQSNETSTAQIYIQPFPNGVGSKSQVSTESGQFPRWRGSDGRELYFVQAANVMAVEIMLAGSSVKPGIPRPLFPLMGNPSVPHPTIYHRYAVTSDGQRFLFAQPAESAAGTRGVAGALANNADQTAGGSLSTVGAVNVIRNWTQSLKRR